MEFYSFESKQEESYPKHTALFLQSDKFLLESPSYRKVYGGWIQKLYGSLALYQIGWSVF